MGVRVGVSVRVWLPGLRRSSVRPRWRRCAVWLAREGRVCEQSACSSAPCVEPSHRSPVCVFVRMHLCMYVCICVCTYAFCVCTYAFVYARMHLCVYVCMHSSVYARMHLCTHVCIRVVCTLVYARVRMHVRMGACTNACICHASRLPSSARIWRASIHTYVRTYAHACVCVCVHACTHTFWAAARICRASERIATSVRSGWSTDGTGREATPELCAGAEGAMPRSCGSARTADAWSRREHKPCQ